MDRLLNLLFFTLFAGWLSSANGYQCPQQVPPNCECLVDGDRQQEFICSISKEYTTTVFKSWMDEGKFVVVECFGQPSHLALNEVIPEHISADGDEKYVIIALFCPLNENVTVKNYIDRLGVTAATDLILSDSTIKKEIFAGTTNITKLILNSHNITSLPSDVFEYLTDLETVKFILNAFSSLPEQLFSKNKKLKKFTFSENSNSLPLPAGLFSNLPYLEFVSVQQARILSVTFDLFAESRNIKFISLENNALSTIPEQLFSSQIRLEELNLSMNNLRVIPENLFKTNVELRILKLNINKIVSLPATLFEDCKELREIDLSYNKIESIPDNLLSSLDQLKELYLYNNRIQRLSTDMLPVHITSLDLRKNRLEVIDRNFLIRFKNGLYKNFRFNNNPIKCECSDDLLALDAVSSKIKRFSSYRCGGNATQRVADAVDECKLRSS